jgi:hypothetical protein
MIKQTVSSAREVTRVSAAGPRETAKSSHLEHETELAFAVVRPLPVCRLAEGELVLAPLEYSTLASRPEPCRVI